MNAEQFNNIIKQQQEEIERLRKENEELKSQRPKHTCPQDEDLTWDANYEYYYASTEDRDEMTIWKVPRHLAEIKSSTPNNWENAVAECFRDEKFGENWDKLNYLIVREMKLKDLVKRKWKPAAEKPKEEEEEVRVSVAEKQRSELEAWRQDFRDGKFEPKEKEETEYSCDNCGHQFKNEEEWSGNCDEHSCSNCECDCSDCAEEEPNSEDDDYEDKMAGKLNCRRCDEAKAWSYVFDGGECLNYCSPCLAELEDKKYIVKAEENQNGIQYRFIEQ